MAKVVTAGATFTCPHTGVGSFVIAPSTEMTISGVAVVDIAEVVGILKFSIAGCTWTGGGNVPCTALISVTGGATKLTKGSIKVSLDTDTYSTNGNGGSPPVMSITEAQTKFTAV